MQPTENINTANTTIQNQTYLTPWLVCFSAALFFFYEFIQMNMFNAISPDLMQAFSINATDLGKLSAYYFYANLLFLPVAGSLLDRFSTRKIILIALTICVIGITGFAASTSLGWASTFRFMSGIGSAFCFLSSMRLASRWFPTHRMALITGLIVTMAMTGGMIAQTPLTVLTNAIGWRNALLIDALLGLLIIGIIFSVVRDYPAGGQNEDQTTHNELKSIGILRSWSLAYLNVRNWLAGIYTCLMNLPCALLGAIWGALYLQQTQHISATQASLPPTLLFVGTIIGGPVVGWISDKIKKRILPMIIGALLSLALIFTLIYLPNLSLTTYVIIFFLLGFITSTQVISYPLVAESNLRALTATSVSVVSFSVISGYAIFQPLFGWLMDLYWHGSIVDKVRIYTESDFHRALWIMPIGFLVALVATLFMRETHCQPRD